MTKKPTRVARRILGARNDTEAVDRALDAVVYQDEVFAAVDRALVIGPDVRHGRC